MARAAATYSDKAAVMKQGFASVPRQSALTLQGDSAVWDTTGRQIIGPFDVNDISIPATSDAEPADIEPFAYRHRVERKPGRIASRVTAVKGNDESHPLAIVAADFGPIRAPTGGGLIDRDAAIMAAFGRVRPASSSCPGLGGRAHRGLG
jgi:hypothetical protein